MALSERSAKIISYLVVGLTMAITIGFLIYGLHTAI